MRILDLDLDFFVHGVVHWRAFDADHVDGSEYPAWDWPAVESFLTERCLLTEKLPGIVVERHAELFFRWRDAIDADVFNPPFAVTHVDAHADLGLGDAGYMHLMTELLYEPAERRLEPDTGDTGLDDGNWLLFAIACRWLKELTYVYSSDSEEDGNPGDILALAMEDFDPGAGNIELKAATRRAIENSSYGALNPPKVDAYEPKVPFTALGWRRFQASEPFDVVCLTRSKAFTPPQSDAIFDAIRERFIDETGLEQSASHCRGG
jgi:hypothetical protein